MDNGTALYIAAIMVLAFVTLCGITCFLCTALKIRDIGASNGSYTAGGALNLAVVSGTTGGGGAGCTCGTGVGGGCGGGGGGGCGGSGGGGSSC